MISELKNLYKESFDAGKKLNDAMIELSSLLGKEDFYRVQNLSFELEELFSQALSVKNYKDFAISTSRLLQQTKNLISIIGERYDVDPYNSVNLP